MVKTLHNDIYSTEKELMYKEYFNTFPYTLSSFQKFAIEAIVTGNHSLSCVPTGSGKTLPALFAIDYFTSTLNKKVIYTSPIKALSNQKYYEFTQKFPHLSIGILTGDIKINPEAQVLIMTAEILQNTLYNKQSHNKNKETPQQPLLFDMDFDTELGCVIQDEVHMINDESRGHIWENTILCLPVHVQMVMLSATLGNPVRFAEWIESCNKDNNERKQVYLSTSTHRPVPLTHYSFITDTQGVYKHIKDKETQKEIKTVCNSLQLLQDSTGKFNEPNYHRTKKVLDLFEKNKVFIKRSQVLNNVCKYMVENKMLPAVCFILSKRQIEVAANEITVPLLEDDSKVGYIVQTECEQILRNKLPNFQEYLHLPEYINMVNLLEKGIGIHHSGIMPILREIVEILFEKGYIKLLFATETFSVGLNMPIKTALFVDVKKFDGNCRRMMYSHEFTQAAGRAGRRGIDTVGNVIHLHNLFRQVELTDYRMMMNGTPQTLVSKFKVSYNLVLSLIDTDKLNDDEKYYDKSMIQDSIRIKATEITKKISHIQQQIDERTQYFVGKDKSILDYYLSLCNVLKTATNKKRKTTERELTMMKDKYRTIEKDAKKAQDINLLYSELEKQQELYTNETMCLQKNTSVIVDILHERGLIEMDSVKKMKLTPSGFIASQINEVPCMVMAIAIKEQWFNDLESIELAMIFSCFTNIVVSDEVISISPHSSNPLVNSTIYKLQEIAYMCLDMESDNGIHTGVDFTMNYDIIDYVEEWCNSSSESECKWIIQKVEKEKEIFLGEFIKALLKITNMATELERIFESIGDIHMLQKMKEISPLIIKYVATNQSLYL